MHDLPSQTLLQQAHARPKGGEELEVLGKQAASLYLSGECSNLTEAVVETVKHAGLSPEQVKRVVEFTNTSAYLKEFEKKGSSHRYIDFHGGPANPAEILKDLNDGGGGTVFDRGDGDYKSPPSHFSKTASLAQRNMQRLTGQLEKTASVEKVADFDPAETAFEQMMRVDEKPIPYANPWAEIEDMREKLASARDHLTSDLSRLETDFMVLNEELYGHVKQAAMEGIPLGYIVQAWGEVTPGPGFVKAAFASIGPRLARDGVFANLGDVGDSLVKTAEGAMADHRHPLLQCFAAFCTTLEKTASVRATRDEVAQYHAKTDYFIKKGALIPKSGAGPDS
jgi:hypothetical protein